jgi:hypothetical protein
MTALLILIALLISAAYSSTQVSAPNRTLSNESKLEPIITELSFKNATSVEEEERKEEKENLIFEIDPESTSPDKSISLINFDNRVVYTSVLSNLNQSFYCPIKNKMIIWDELFVNHPAAIVKDNKLFLLYASYELPRSGKRSISEDINKGTARIGLSWGDGPVMLHRAPGPILFPSADSNIKCKLAR